MAFLSPATVVLAVIRLPSDLVANVIGGEVKSDSTGVIDIGAPVLMMIGNSPWRQEVNIVGGSEDFS